MQTINIQIPATITTMQQKPTSIRPLTEKLKEECRQKA